MFDPVSAGQSLPELERGILKYWKEEDIFKRSLKQRARTTNEILDGKPGGKGDIYSFYDGPPFATGLPHYGHLLAGTIKDVIPRYQTMRGKYVQRRFGWDCHGLPVENIVEKEYEIKDRGDIEKMGVAKFNALCRGAVQRYTKEWRTVVERMGRWVDMDWDYRTMDPDYMESIWWVFSQLHQKELIYEGHKPMHICPRCETPLSNFEVTQGYKDITDQSVYVKLELVDEPGTYLLVWTTTGWTLPGNVLAAVHPKIAYVKVRVGKDRLILARDRVEAVFGKEDYEVEGAIKASALIGKRYKPIFPYFMKQLEDKAFRIVGADYVTTDAGTGAVHLAPAFGEEDFYQGQQEKVPLIQHVGMDGRFIAAVTDFAGQEAKPMDDPTKTDRKIAEHLQKRGLLYKMESFKHSYPHCWRCDHPLLNYATSSWFVTVEKIKEKLLLNNAKTEWVPSHLRDGRFGKWLENARDWAISRNRYWGTPLPIWRCKKTGELEVIGSRDELMAKNRIRFTKITTVRHAESTGNLTPIYQGVVPGTDLTDNGKKQAQRAAEFINKGDVHIIYCSPLARARQTADAIAKETGAKVIVDDRLREVAFGAYEGKSVDYSDLSFVKARRAKKIEENAPESIYHFPGMETWQSVQARIADFMNEVLPMHRGEHIVVVTHADPVINFRHFFTKEDAVKLSHQPYPRFAEPVAYFWDHEANAQMDLHKEVVDTVRWPGAPVKGKSVEITMVRHGQTDWNLQEICQGQEADRPLTELGKEQALDTAKKLKKEKFDGIVVSDLLRATQTAEIIAKELDLPILEETMLLRERKYGDWVGKNLKDILKKEPMLVPQGEFGVYHRDPPNGETLTDFVKRAEQAYEYLLEQYPGKKLLVVCHGGIMRTLTAVTENLTYIETLKERPENAEAKKLLLHPRLERIPEVLDCWFESGSMPYAQNHYPFSFEPLPLSYVEPKKKKDLPPGFPADFIAEGVDQTRGWFYTLAVLGTALFDKPAFQNCVVNGIVLAEDGKKMSKRLKNYPEPTEIVEKHGADAVRFTLMRSPAVRGEDLRFSEKLVEETVRNTLLPLWNSYSFFVTYANAAGFQPKETRRHSDHALDCWMRAEVQDLVNRMTEQLENYDLSATCAELSDTIDALTNWYIRLSRRRFAGKGALDAEDPSGDREKGDQHDALETLYDVLLTISQVLAPFAPYIADAVYLNLVEEEHGSIHMTDWPEVRALKKEEKMLLDKTRLLRAVVSLGLKVRSEAKIKVRSPLAKATIALPPTLQKNVNLSDEDLALIRQELNVKEIAFEKNPERLAEVFVQVDARKVGPRLGGRVQEVIAAGKKGEFEQKEDGSILILEETLAPDEAQIVYRGREGQGVAADHGVVVSLDTALTEELKSEGIARDLVREIQKLRKEKGLAFTDKILLQIDGLNNIVDQHKALIEEETRGTLGKNDGDEHTMELDEGTVTIRFKKK